MNRIWAHEHHDEIAPYVWDALRSLNDQSNSRIVAWWLDFKTNVGEASRSEGHVPMRGKRLPPLTFTVTREGNTLAVEALGQVRIVNISLEN